MSVMQSYVYKNGLI